MKNDDPLAGERAQLLITDPAAIPLLVKLPKPADHATRYGKEDCAAIAGAARTLSR
jgi:hypothetical protein